MAQGSDHDPYCSLNLMQLRNFRTNVRYEKTGLGLTCVITGTIDCDYFDPGPGTTGFAAEFRNKSVRIEICSPPDQDLLEKIAETLNVPNAIGFATVNAKVEPKKYQVDDQQFEEEPVRAMLSVPSGVAISVCDLLDQAFVRQRLITAELKLSGSTLPDADRWGHIHLSDLNVSDDMHYAISEFNLHETQYTDTTSGKTLPAPLTTEKRQRIGLRVLINEIECTLPADPRLPQTFYLHGQIITSPGQRYDSADIWIRLEEYNLAVEDTRPDMPFGNFDYYPDEGDSDKERPHFSVRLRDGLTDYHLMLQTLFTATARVGLELDLCVNEGEPTSRRDKFSGHVRTYSFRLAKEFTR